ncbi:Inner membrane protein YohK [Pseudomonas sp. MM221]|nr:Inner membrane protein YohK [Pseudomonas sp. MM221]
MSLEPMPLFWLALTLLAYLGSRWLYRRSGRYVLSPLILVPVLLLAVAVPLHTAYAEYARNTHWLMGVLGPVTVAFAVPIWQQRAMLARHWPALMMGMIAGSSASIASSWGLAHLLALDNATSLSLVPRSITTPFAMPLAHDLGGVPERQRYS